jgi:O-antigen/teichoic acid export membrane protein
MLKAQINNLITRFKRFFPEGSFAHNLLVTFSGNALALFLGLLFTPFIARLYGPEAYGVFALFAALINNISPLITWQFPTGYPTIKDDQEFYGVVQLNLLVVGVMVFLCLLVAGMAGGRLLAWLSLKELTPYLWLMPLYFLLIGVEQITRGWSIRLAEFKRSASGRVGATLSSKVTTLLFGFGVRADAWGIMLGDVLQYPVEGLWRISSNMGLQLRQILRKWYAGNVLQLMHRYRAYPKYITTGLLLSNFSNQLPVYMLAYSYNQATVGLFALASSLVTMPINVLVMSSTTVFLKKASELYHHRPDELGDAVERLYRQFTGLSTVLLVGLALVAQPVFVLLFGEAWSESGVFAALLAMSFVPAVTAQPLSTLFRIMQRERINFLLNVLGIVLRGGALLAGATLGGARTTLAGYALATALTHYLMLWVIFSLCKVSLKKLMADALLTVLLLAGVAAFYNFAF